MAEIGCVVVCAIAAIVVAVFIVVLVQTMWLHALAFIVVGSIVVALVESLRYLYVIPSDIDSSEPGRLRLRRLWITRGEQAVGWIQSHNRAVGFTLLVTLGAIIAGSRWGENFFIIVLAIPFFIGFLCIAAVAGGLGGRTHVRGHWRGATRVRSYTRRR